MSGTQCSICLENFADPVSIPCGHIYCSQCLVDHINTSQTSNQRRLTSTCPTCRTEFQLKTPDLRPLPRKLHPFIQPHIRRVFFDNDATEEKDEAQATIRELRAQLQTYEDQVKRLQDREQHLMRACRLTAESAEEYRNREWLSKTRLKEAQVKIQTLNGEVVCAERAAEAAGERERVTARALAKAVEELANFRFDCRENHVSRALVKAEAEVARRKSLDEESTNALGHGTVNQKLRAIRPLPRRRSRTPLEIGDAINTTPLSLSKRPRLSLGSKTLR